MMSSFSPGGTDSDSMSVTNPAWYSRFVSSAMELLVLMPFPIYPSFTLFNLDEKVNIL